MAVNHFNDSDNSNCKVLGDGNCSFTTNPSFLWTKTCLLSLFEHGVEGSSDDDPADFTRARSDLIQLCVSKESPHRIVINVTVPACRGATQIRCVTAHSY